MTFAKSSAASPLDGPDLFPIRALTERTGVGGSTLRAWERRYRLLDPQRKPKGHRLYSEQDALRVMRILELLKEGHSLPAIAEQMRHGKDSNGTARDKLAQSGVWHGFVEDTLLAVADFSHERVEALFNDAMSLYPVEMVTERLIEPVLVALGEQWRHTPVGIAEEHFYTSWVRNRLGARFHHSYGQARGARLICACAPGNFHDIGLLLFAISALTRGYRVLYFGPDLPLEQIAPVLERSGARAVVLSVRMPPRGKGEEELAELTRTIPAPLMLGGNGSDQPLPAFEAAGGIRLGSRIAVAMQVLGSHIPVHSGGRGGNRRQKAAHGL